jgi:uncharacterized protein (DUF1499 family)
VTLRRLDPCPALPNCVSSQAPAHDTLHHLAPLPIGSDRVTTISAVLRVIARTRGLRVLERDDHYVHAVAHSRVLRLPSDVELVADNDAGLLHVRAASRYGRSDLGANRRRAQTLLEDIERELRRSHG